MKKKACVTGGAGFIGSHMVDCLIERDYEVRIIDNLSGGHEQNLNHHKNNPLLKTEWCDICNINENASIFKGVSYIFHFAGLGDIVPSIENPTEYMNINVQGTVNMLECARNNNISKFVYAASSSCYGLAKTPTTEDDPIDPQYPYALSKYLGEVSVMHWHKVYNLPVNSIRIFNAYGTRVRTTGVYGAVFGIFFKQKLANKPFTVVGNGEQRRDFIYVSDVAEAFFQAAKTELNGQIWNVGSDNPQSINKLVQLIGGDIVYIPKRPGEPDCTWANISKIKKDLAWQPEVSFEDGVKKMCDDISHWQDAPLWTPETINDATKIWFKFLDK